MVESSTVHYPLAGPSRVCRKPLTPLLEVLLERRMKLIADWVIRTLLAFLYLKEVRVVEGWSGWGLARHLAVEEENDPVLPNETGRPAALVALHMGAVRSLAMRTHLGLS